MANHPLSLFNSFTASILLLNVVMTILPLVSLTIDHSNACLPHNVIVLPYLSVMIALTLLEQFSL